MDEPQMAELLVAHRRSGFYFRVLQEGFRVLQEGKVGAGDEIIRIAQGPERMTVVETDELLYTPDHPRSQIERALRIPALSIGWRGSF